MEQNNGENWFSQDGVLLKKAKSYYMQYLQTTGTISLIISPDSERFLEWRPSDISIDSVVQEEWAVVSATSRNQQTSTEESKPKFIKIPMRDIHSFRVTKKEDKLHVYDGAGEDICEFFFQHGNCAILAGYMKQLLNAQPSKRDRYLFVAPPEIDKLLQKSFAELNLFPDEKPSFVWDLVKNIHQRPVETALDMFSKVSAMATSETYRESDETDKENLNGSAAENDGSVKSSEGYEVLPPFLKLPERKDYPRINPITSEQFADLMDSEGRIEDIATTKLHIFKGGVSPNLRKEVWKYLLDYYPWTSSSEERRKLVREKREEYYTMKVQWKSISKVQEANFSDYRERRSIIEKDVNRTDRTLPYYAGDNNTNLQTLFNILMTYVMYNFDLGYVQGMSDLLSPILCLLDNEVDAFWCFVGFMKKVSSNFDMDQLSIKKQLENLHRLVTFVDPTLANYLDNHDSGNMFFCFRWLLVWFKRELSQDEVMQLWEVLWTGLPCRNFHLLISVAILETQRTHLIENQYSFTEILKHINDLAGHLNVAEIINIAEGTYNQIVNSDLLNDSIRAILGMPLMDKAPSECSFSSDNDEENDYERAITHSFL